MQKKYFSSGLYNDIPCGIVVVKKTDQLEIVYANEYYYVTFADGNYGSLNLANVDTEVPCDFEKCIEEKRNKGIICSFTFENKMKGYASVSVGLYNDGLLLFIITDITTQYEDLERLKLENKNYSTIMNGLGTIIYKHDVVNDCFTLYMPSKEGQEPEKKFINNVLKYIDEKCIYKNDKKIFFDNIFDEKEKTLSARFKLPGDKEWTWYRIYRHFNHDKDGKVISMIGMIYNIDNEKKQEAEFKKKFDIDPILQVFNRHSAIDKINTYLTEHPDRRDYAFMVLDIDNFKNINDTYGHLYGDTIIALAAEIMRSCVGDNGIVGRYGGDEFLVFMKELSDEEIFNMSDDIIEQIGKSSESGEYGVTCSAGVVNGSLFKSTPGYKELFEKADKALYSSKANGKAHWELYDSSMESIDNKGSITYGKEDTLDNAELSDTKDFMKLILEMSVGVQNSDMVVYKIMNYIAEKYNIDWFQIMQVDGEEDLITIKYEWGERAIQMNNAGKSGYYVHSDINRFRNYFKGNPIFHVCPENTEGFSMKFFREFEKNMKHSVIYNANVTADKKFYMFVFTRFDKDKKWTDEECEDINNATKIMSMYVSQADKETDQKKRMRSYLELDRKTKLYSVMKFYEQMGRLRKSVVDSDDQIVCIHTDFGNFIDFNSKFGHNIGTEVLVEFSKFIQGNENPKINICTHIDGTDIFIAVRRISEDIHELAKGVKKKNCEFCEMINKKYKGGNIILKSGLSIITRDCIADDKLDCVIFAKKTIKNPKESFCIVCEEDSKTISYF